MSKICLLYGYNKYNNRIIKKLPDFESYENLTKPSGDTPALYKGVVRNNINFDYEDGVHAKVILNLMTTDPANIKLSEPDYLVLEESLKIDDETTTTKLSRWYILDSTRIRGLQYELSLRRDLLADYYEEVTEAPVFIERGNPQIDDPALFNKESFTYNQIKKGEYLLNNTPLAGRDKSGWVIGYLARNAQGKDFDVTIKAEYETPSETPTQFISLPAVIQDAINGDGVLRAYNSYQYDLRITAYYNGTYAKIFYFKRNGASHTVTYGDQVNDGNFSYPSNAMNIDGTRFIGSSPFSYLEDEFIWWDNNTALKTNINNDMAAVTNGFDSSSNNYLSLNGSVVEKDGITYRLVITPKSTSSRKTQVYSKSQINSDYNALAQSIRLFISLLSQPLQQEDYLIDSSQLGVESKLSSNLSEIVADAVQIVEEYDISLELVTFVTGITLHIDKDRNQLIDAPYDMFCIPLGSLSIFNSSTKVCDTMINLALPAARELAEQYSNDGTKYVYDIQVLPYCPFPEIFTSDGDIQISGLRENQDYNFIEGPESGGAKPKLGIVIYPLRSKGTFNITIPTDLTNNAFLANYCLADTTDIISKKVKSETHLVRFVSPNFSSIFEINPQKNNGIAELNVDYFYKPYVPYLHVAPYFSGLYGEDFDDPKGLICSGEFSISTASDQWEAYQIQNKNYEAIFNRQIQNLDVNNSLTYDYTKKAGIINAFSSGLGGAIAGAGAGAVLGSVVPGLGTVAGAALGGIAGGGSSGVASAFGLKYDLEYLTKTQQEARSFTIDMYNYQLGNIKALPNSLTRVTTLTQNNKIFPFLEFYDCTETEKEALRNKLTYNGFTIMRIGKIKDFIQGQYNYVQGQLIRLLGIDDSNHVIAEIANEIKQGAYYYGNTSES